MILEFQFGHLWIIIDAKITWNLTAFEITYDLELNIWCNFFWVKMRHEKHTCSSEEKKINRYDLIESKRNEKRHKTRCWAGWQQLHLHDTTNWFFFPSHCDRSLFALSSRALIAKCDSKSIVICCGFFFLSLVWNSFPFLIQTCCRFEESGVNSMVFHIIRILNGV